MNLWYVTFFETAADIKYVKMKMHRYYAYCIGVMIHKFIKNGQILAEKIGPKLYAQVLVLCKYLLLRAHMLIFLIYIVNTYVEVY